MKEINELAYKQGHDGELRELALFAGIGGGILASKMLGWRTVCAVEIEPYRRAILCQRQNDGILPIFPIWDDVRTFDGKPWRGRVNVVSGGFPCQDISVAGSGAGIEGERSGLWKEFSRIICEVRPIFAFVENSPALTFRGIDRVLGDLAEMGYNAEYGVLAASDVGAPHKRERIWIIAYSKEIRLQRIWSTRDKITDKNGSSNVFIRNNCDGRMWASEPDVCRVANGIPFKMERITSLGDAQVPLCAAEAFRMLYGRIKESSC